MARRWLSPVPPRAAATTAAVVVVAATAAETSCPRVWRSAAAPRRVVSQHPRSSLGLPQQQPQQQQQQVRGSSSSQRHSHHSWQQRSAEVHMSGVCYLSRRERSLSRFNTSIHSDYPSNNIHPQYQPPVIACIRSLYTLTLLIQLCYFFY